MSVRSKLKKPMLLCILEVLLASCGGGGNASSPTPQIPGNNPGDTGNGGIGSNQGNPNNSGNPNGPGIGTGKYTRGCMDDTVVRAKGKLNPNPIGWNDSKRVYDKKYKRRYIL